MEVSKTTKAIRTSHQLAQNLKKMEESGALHLGREKREVCLIRKIFWGGKDLVWRQNFTPTYIFY
ncbi:hypothetical protein [Algoriphagus sp. NG3]|uniref:hypothetical protein n=1 Tax=unclassified Algoriphagus TaxID=2641541 RepID=UPI002A80595A|nr:hypothetical protein [Algoriphagus sp. NG3]WPR75288.1 hypothetical protein SLW71_21735 [Algoriphagus sp. NG3]